MKKIIISLIYIALSASIIHMILGSLSITALFLLFMIIMGNFFYFEQKSLLLKKIFAAVSLLTGLLSILYSCGLSPDLFMFLFFYIAYTPLAFSKSIRRE